MHTRSSVLAALLAAALAGASLAGCGGGGAGDGTAQPGENVSSSASSGSGSSPGLPPTGRISPPPDSSSKQPSGELTLTGRPEEGVEANCVIMQSGGTTYLLLGGDRALLKSGRTLIVRGKPNPGLITTCQQGIPFEVSEVRPA